MQEEKKYLTPNFIDASTKVIEKQTNTQDNIVVSQFDIQQTIEKKTSSKQNDSGNKSSDQSNSKICKKNKNKIAIETSSDEKKIQPMNYNKDEVMDDFLEYQDIFNQDNSNNFLQFNKENNLIDSNNCINIKLESKNLQQFDKYLTFNSDSKKNNNNKDSDSISPQKINKLKNIVTPEKFVTNKSQSTPSLSPPIGFDHIYKNYIQQNQNKNYSPSKMIEEQEEFDLYKDFNTRNQEQQIQKYNNLQQQQQEINEKEINNNKYQNINEKEQQFQVKQEEKQEQENDQNQQQQQYFNNIKSNNILQKNEIKQEHYQDQQKNYNQNENESLFLKLSKSIKKRKDQDKNKNNELRLFQNISNQKHKYYKLKQQEMEYNYQNKPKIQYKELEQQNIKDQQQQNINNNNEILVKTESENLEYEQENETCLDSKQSIQKEESQTSQNESQPKEEEISNKFFINHIPTQYDMQDFLVQQEQKKRQVQAFKKLQLAQNYKNTQKEIKIEVFCKCSDKVKCIKDYCACFKAGLECNSKCACTGCFNNNQNETRNHILMQRHKQEIKKMKKREKLQIQQQLIENKLKQSLAQKQKMSILEQEKQMQFTQIKLQKYQDNKDHIRCTCKKSGCKKKYCECFKAGVVCTDACECTHCENHTQHQNNKCNINKHQELIIKQCYQTNPQFQYYVPQITVNEASEKPTLKVTLGGSCYGNSLNINYIMNNYQNKDLYRRTMSNYYMQKKNKDKEKGIYF